MNAVGLMVRLAPEVRDWLAQEARKDERSMNWLINSILKQQMTGATLAGKENAPTAVTVGAPI